MSDKKPKTQVTNINEALGVLVQVASLAQKSGILSLDDAVITKSAIDFLGSYNSPEVPLEIDEKTDIEEGPKG
tara:strand:+ start:361 stop:579 length:219 start_codon:yes stop_codon:yes gene_type:complete